MDFHSLCSASGRLLECMPKKTMYFCVLYCNRLLYSFTVVYLYIYAYKKGPSMISKWSMCWVVLHSKV